MKINRFSWEKALVSQDRKKLPSSARLFLLTLGTFVLKKDSVECWPSLGLIASRSGLSYRATVNQMKLAVSRGWIGKRTGKVPGMKRPGNIYYLTIPLEAMTSASSSLVNHANAERTQSEGSFASKPPRLVQPETSTSASDDTRLVHLTTTVSNKEKEGEVKEEEENRKSMKTFLERFGRKGEERQRQPQPPTHPLPLKAETTSKAAWQGNTLETWAAANGYRRLSSEDDRAFKLRVGQEYARIKTLEKEGELLAFCAERGISAEPGEAPWDFLQRARRLREEKRVAI